METKNLSYGKGSMENLGTTKPLDEKTGFSNGGFIPDYYHTPSKKILEVESPQHPEPQEVYKVYRKRWIMLGVFMCFSMANSFQWIQYSIVNTLMVQYYSVTPVWIDNTALIFSFVYIPLIFPATYLLQVKGLRTAVLLGAFGTAVGSWIKVASASPNLFWVAFLGQTIVACSQTFILEVPPLIAAVWFGPDQVSTATSIGVFGNQLGIALGFLIPPMVVKNGTEAEISRGLNILNYGLGGITLVIFVALFFIFQEKPPKPPSIAQAAVVASNVEKEDYLRSIKRLMTNKAFMLLVLSYGLNVGVFYAISTLLSNFILAYWDGYDEDAGRIGLVIVLAGMVGSVLSGLILDKTKRYKETTLGLYVLALVSMVSYTFVLIHGNQIYYLYLVMAALGFFMTGYLPVGFEFAAEITYPESEGTSSGLLNCSVQIFGVILIPVTRAIFESSAGDFGANITLCVLLLIGVIITLLIKPKLRRLAAQKEGSIQESV